MAGMTAFMVAVGGTSLACYFLMNRAQARQTRRYGDGGHSSSADVSGGDGWSLLSPFGSGGSSCDSDSSGDFGGDSGGGCDGGGGGGD